jgi:hypothetical protein
MSDIKGIKKYLVFIIIIIIHYVEYTMNRRSNKRFNQNQQKEKKVIRCDNLSRPVFDSDTCSEFKTSVGKESEKICKNCTYSF